LTDVGRTAIVLLILWLIAVVPLLVGWLRGRRWGFNATVDDDAMPTLRELLLRAWAKRSGSKDDCRPAVGAEAPARPQRFAVPREYLSLYTYLDKRFANTVVLTFAQIEDLLGFALPDLARLHREWWANGDANNIPSAQARSWTQASRTATPNLLARTVVFERATG
jgi:hypothetical protein